MLLWSCLTRASTDWYLVLTCQQTVYLINAPYEWKYHRLFANTVSVSVSVLFLLSNYIKWSLPGCILNSARCSLTFQDQEVPISWLVIPLRQSNMPHATREQPQDSYFVQKWQYRGGILSVIIALSHTHQILLCSSFVTNYKPQTFHEFLLVLIFMLYFVKQTCSAANVAQDPAELLLQPHRISYLVGLQLLKISTPYVLVPFTCFCFPFSPISHVLY